MRGGRFVVGVGRASTGAIPRSEAAVIEYFQSGCGRGSSVPEKRTVSAPHAARGEAEEHEGLGDGWLCSAGSAPALDYASEQPFWCYPPTVSDATRRRGGMV